jgi:hypothetical protein
VILADLNRTYPSIFSLCGFTPHLVAHHFEERAEDPEAVTAFLRAPDLRERLDERSKWANWATTFVLVEPRGEPAPHQRKVSTSWRFVHGPLDLGGGRIWCHVFDLLLGALRGEVPTIVAGFSVVALANTGDLRLVRLPSGRTLDLGAEDWGRALIDERTVAEQIADPLLRTRRVALAKALSVAGAWGIFGRTDRLRAPRPVVVEVEVPDSTLRRRRRYPATEVVRAIGPDGQALEIETDRPERSGPLTLWHLAAAIPAACRAIVGIATFDLEQHGIDVAATMTDALAIAARLEQREIVREVLGRWDPVLHPRGGAAFKYECDSFDRPTLGLVLGVNKVLLARTLDGRIVLVRSSDTGLGDHFCDPTGTGARLSDGRCGWVAELEARLVTHVATTGVVEVPPDLPTWATDRPAMRPGQVLTMAELVDLRRRIGDPTIQIGARFVACGGEDGPVCLGAGRDPATWRTWPWRWRAGPCRPTVLDEDGAPVEYQGEGPLVVVPALADVLARWLTEHDRTMAGRLGELRRPVAVRSHPVLVRLAGRDTTWTEDPDTEPLDYGPLVGEEDLLAQATTLEAATLTDAGIAPRTARRIRAGGSRPRTGTRLRLTAAVATAAKRRCTAPGCANVLSGRRDRRFCSTACRKAAARVPASGPVPDDVRAALEAGSAKVCSHCGAVLLGAAADGSCIACGSALGGAT